MIEEDSYALDITACGEELECADPDVARRNSEFTLAALDGRRVGEEAISTQFPI